MPPDLAQLLAQLASSIGDHNAAIAAGRIGVNDWQQLVARDLLTGHYAAYMLGFGSKDIGPSGKETVGTLIAEQIDYLNRFADAIDVDGWRPAFGARALMYSGSVKESFWRGRTFGLELPYYPAQGTDCLTNCKCAWNIDWLDQEELNADCTWIRGADDSCETCIARAGVGVIRIRGGERV